MTHPHKPLPQRKSPRLQGYDYAQSGAYFVTICTHQRLHLFGQVIDDTMVLSKAGEIAASRWQAIPEHHPHVELDAFVIMPNHMHGIIVITDNVGTGPALSENTKQRTTQALSLQSQSQDNKSSKARSLSTIIGSYKSGVTRRIRNALNTPNSVIWQSRYHDHIIRDENELHYIRRYILYNPALWEADKFYTP